MPLSSRSTRRRPRAVMRADASSSLGTGHVMRCLALAAELTARGWGVTFSMAPGPGDLRDAIRASGYEVRSVDALEFGRLGRIDWLIVDHYDIDATWLRRSRRVARRRLVIDDLGTRDLDADVLLDPNLDASAAKYAGRFARAPRMLLGPRYALLRPEFAEARPRVRPTPQRVSRVLVSMGGSDPGNATRLAVAAARDALPTAEIDVVLGPAYPHEPPSPDGHMRILMAPSSMADLIVDADLAIAAAGTSALERAALGLPSIVLRLAENQVAVAEHLQRAGIAWDAGWATDARRAGLVQRIVALAGDPDARDRMHAAGLTTLDGLGARRVGGVIDPIRLRRAQWDDRHVLLSWSNDPATRRNSLSPHRIAMDEHEAWLRARLADEMCELLVGENGRGPVGQVRLQRTEAFGEVSIAVAPEARGGTGGQLLEAAVRRWRRAYRELPLRARIIEGNAPSVRLFERTGFRVIGSAASTLILGYEPGRASASTREP